MGPKPPRDTRILLVDDEADFRGVLARSFQRAGYDVVCASNGKEAFEIARGRPVDVIISDIRMPGGDGIELLDRVKELCPATPIILLMSGYAEMTTEEACSKGAEALFCKPLDRKMIQETINQLLTPPEERWTRLSERMDASLVVELRFQTFQEAVNARVVNLGRGGMFIFDDGGYRPQVNDVVSFILTLGPGGEISGSAVVRWVRTQSTKGLPAGFGVEFTYLGQKELQQVMEYLDSNKVKAFIPKG